MSRRRILLTTLFAALFALLAMLRARTISTSAITIGRTLFTKLSARPPPIMASQNATVIVVGSGLAGLTASYEALLAGAPVKMLDRAAKPGGNSIKASSGINGAGTRFQRDVGIVSDLSFYDDSVRSAGRRFKEWEQSGGPGPVNRGTLTRVLTEGSRGAVEWLVDEIGVDLSVVAALGGHSVARTHRGAGKLPPGAALVSAFLAKLKEDPKFELVSGAEVTGLTAAAGAVTGVEYTSEGQEHQLAGPVMFATGGFAGDASGELATYRPDLKAMPSTAEARPGTHAMLTSVGAALVDMDSVQIHPTGFVDPEAPYSTSKFLAAEMLRGEGGILLDSEGRRFVGELERRDFLSERIMSMTPSAGSEDVKQWDVTVLLDAGACEAASSHLGFYIFKGLMQKKKVRDLDERVIRSIDEYADIVAGKTNADPFGRRNFGHWRLKSGEENRDEEVCVGKVTPVVHFTMGGVAFDDKARVLREDGRVVEGLYAAGEVTGGLHGDNRLGGSSLLECVVYGRIAGRELANILGVKPSA
ncbi:related to soluble fumarate reductase (NADH) [Cephalotrichum gorgonifer]|uniref:Fumarate reductase n=1 Tax=Cephalotrichum gorgonifer TaxID=2041049 RepID=A0AAE8SUU9_9PEZI|nr:related to soluble fumarate reductase (NADH) [Cephalotrichum gorgonifer]